MDDIKITKRQLRRIIREAMGPDHSRYGNDPLYVTTSDIRGHGQPTERYPTDREGIEWEIGDKVVANGYPGVIEDVATDGIVDVRLKRGVVSVAGSTITRQLGTPPLNQYFRESAEINESSPAPMRSRAHPQFAKIIKRSLNETLQSAEEKLFAALDEYVNILDEDMGYDVPNRKLKAEVFNFVDGYFEQSEYAAEQAELEEGEEGTFSQFAQGHTSHVGGHVGE